MHNVVLRGGLAGLLLLVLGAGPAVAHASLVRTDPEDGASLATAPPSITLTFNENIGEPAYIAVTAPDGTVVKTSSTKVLDNTVSATVDDPGKRGRYTASYRVVSADGHPVGGTFHYTVTTGATVKQVDTPGDDESFVHRHRTHLIWGILAAIVAIGLLLAPLRRRDDKDGA